MPRRPVTRSGGWVPRRPVTPIIVPCQARTGGNSLWRRPLHTGELSVLWRRPSEYHNGYSVATLRRWRRDKPSSGRPPDSWVDHPSASHCLPHPLVETAPIDRRKNSLRRPTSVVRSLLMGADTLLELAARGKWSTISSLIGRMILI